MNNKFINIYADFLKKFFNPQKPLKVIFDCSNGTAGIILEKLLDTKQGQNRPLSRARPVPIRRGATRPFALRRAVGAAVFRSQF